MSVPLHPSLPSSPTHSAFMSQEEPADRSPGPKIRTDSPLLLKLLPRLGLLVSLWRLWSLASASAALLNVVASSGCLGWLRILVSLYLHVVSVWHYSQFSEEDSLIHSLSCGSPSGVTMFSIRGRDLDKPHLKFQISVSRHRPNNRKQLEYLFKNSGLLELQPLVLTPFYESLCVFF